MKNLMYGRKTKSMAVISCIMALVMVVLIWTSVIAATQNSYRVILNVGIGTLPSGKADVLYVDWGDPYPELPLPSGTDPNLRFAGWYLDPKGSYGTRVRTGDDFGEPGDKVLYALWCSKQYTLYFDANGGSGTMQPEERIFDEFTPLPSNQFANEDRFFICWNTEPDGSGYSYMDGEKAGQIIKDRSGKVTLYAQWSGDSNTAIIRPAYVVGNDDGLFQPTAPISRAETSAIFARIMANYDERNLTATTDFFTDVTPQMWHAKYIARLLSESIIIGYQDGTFKPDDSISRGEFITICVRYYEKVYGRISGASNIGFSDIDSSHWAWDYACKAYSKGYIKGYDDGTLAVDSLISRDEAITIVNRMLERVPDKEYIDENLDKLTNFADVQDNEYWAYYDIFEAANTHYVRINGNGEAKWVE